MADVFISYANEDRETARKLSAALEAHGWSVWWDRNIKAGQAFDDVIERELESAKCVVVLWSKRAIVSEWVKSEAALAAERGVLVPALIEAVRPPLEFRRKQAADLVGWTETASHAGFQGLCDAIASLTVGTERRIARSVASSVVSRLHWDRLGWAAALAAIAAAAAGYWAWQAPHPQDVSGRWVIEATERTDKTYLDFRMRDGALLGSEVILYPNDPVIEASGLKREAAIVDGSVVRDRISFNTKRTYRRIPDQESTRTEAVRHYEGRIDGEKIHFELSDQDGNHVEVTAGRPSTARPAELVAKLEGHREGTLERLVPLPDGRLASASPADRTVKIWNLSTLEAEANLVHDSQIKGALVLPDGRLVSAEDGKVQVWDLRTQKVVARFEELPGLLAAIILCPDGRLAGAYSQGEIALWNIATGRIEKTLKIDDRGILKLAFLPDGRLASGDQDGTVRLWNLASGQAESIVRNGTPGSNDAVTGLTPLKDGRLAFTTANGHAVAIWNPVTGKKDGALPLAPGERAEALAALADGRLAVLGTDNVVTLLNPATGKTDGTFEVGSRRFAASALTQLPDGRLALGSGDGPIEIWKLR